MSCRYTIPELERARVLAFDVGLSCGAIAKLLAYEYGTTHTSDSIRNTLTRRFNWHGQPRGDPSALRREAT